MTTFKEFIIELMQSNGFAFEIIEHDYLEIRSENLQINYFKKRQPNIQILQKTNKINVWEDQWLSKSEIVISRLKSKLRLNDKLPARVCKIRRIDKELCDDFLTSNHLQGTCAAKLKYGLFLPKNYFRLLSENFELNEEEILVAVMTFSGAKKYYINDKVIFSFELIRFASLLNMNIQGGFLKLLQFFIKEKQPGNIMTYVDSDWSDGENYRKFGFRLQEKMPPNFYKLDENNTRKLSKADYDVFNSGSLKFILDLS